MKMPTDQLVKYWKGKEVQCEVDVVEYIQNLRANIEEDMAKENEEEQKGLQKKHNDRKAMERKFSIGNFVLVFRSRKQNKLLNEWQSLLIITKQITEVIYLVDIRKRGKPLQIYYHINAMKSWTSPASAVFLTLEENHDDDQSILDLEVELSNSLSSFNTPNVRVYQDYDYVVNDGYGRDGHCCPFQFEHFTQHQLCIENSHLFCHL